MEKLNIAVLGDSAMWGQGLKTENKFYFLAANKIAQALGREANIQDNDNTARSGAKILAAVQADITKKVVLDQTIAGAFNVKVVKVVDRRGIDVLLPSGKQLKVPKGDRAKFYDTYPTLFQTDEQVIAFFDGRNEEPARQLFGDIPDTFPTITYQVERIESRQGENIDLVFIDGSVNDVNIEEVLDSLDGPEIEKIDVAIRQFAFVELKKLLAKARDKFPNAVILVTGYFSPFSQSSNRDKLQEMAEYMSGKPEWQISTNNFLTSFWGNLLTLGFFDMIGLTKDTNELVKEAVQRSEFAHSRGLYWLRRAVSELNENGNVGPGLYFMNSGFRPENSLFAPSPLLHQGYKPASENDGSHQVQDAALEERTRQIPRLKLLSAFEDIRNLLFTATLPSAPPLSNSSLQQIAELRNKLDGPTSLIQKLKAILEDPFNQSNIRSGSESLNDEIGRIRRGQIASFVHPNERGAQRYADQIVTRYNRHILLSVKSDLSRLAKLDSLPLPEIISVRDTLRIYGIDPKIGLRASMQHMIVDSIAIEMTMTAPSFPPNPFVDLESVAKVFINVGNGRRWRLHNPFGKLNTMDTFGALHLSDIKQLVLEVDEGFRFKLTDFTFLLNGKAVFHSSKQAVLDRGDKVAFAYPTPQRLKFTPETISFGSGSIGVPRELTLTIENPTSRDVNISVPAPPPGSAFIWEAFNGVLANGEKRSFKVTFIPRTSAIQQAQLTVKSTALDSPHSIGLFGKGPGGFPVPEPEPTPSPPKPKKLKFIPETISFGSGSIGVPRELTLTIENPTGRDVNISVLPPPSGSAFIWEAFNGVLANGEKRSFKVTFIPRTSAIQQAQLIVKSTALGSPHAIGLVGKGPGGFPTP